MTFDDFKKMVQTFGASCRRWETDDIASCRIFSKSNQSILTSPKNNLNKGTAHPADES